MVSKIKVASGLLCLLGAFCVFQLVTVGLGFWSLTRTHDDVGDLSNIASSVEELTATVRQNAEHVREANALEGTALEATSRGSAVVNEVVDKMRGIAQSSDKIAEIISVIDRIAFQTNILALNAAVEAARAGEQASSLEQMAAAAAASLRQQTQQLKQAVSVFEISETVLRMQHIDHLRGPMTGLSLSDMRAI
jgi:methyl-accepting chemotaxis protein-1 (serine sensor receptor)